jgi:hypothetical protein
MPPQRPHTEQDRTFEPGESRRGTDPLESRRSHRSAVAPVVAALALMAAVIVLIFVL